MTPAAVFKYFGSQSAAAKALGKGQSTVCEWAAAGIIPDAAQYQIELATQGVLKADKPALRVRLAEPVSLNDNINTKTTQASATNWCETPIGGRS